MSHPRNTISSTRAEVGAAPPNMDNPASMLHPMQAERSTGSSRSHASVLGPGLGQLDTPGSFRSAPGITITENAQKYISEMRERLGLPVKGIRVRATPRSPLRADFAMSFVPAEEPGSSTDLIQSTDGLDAYIDPESAPYLEGATIDFVFKLIGSELKVLAPLRTLDTPDSRIAGKIQQVLAEQVNPALAVHGGEAALIDVKDGIAFLELTGGCQGCSMADATLKNGIEASIRKSVPDLQGVRDVTEHAKGRNPYFRQ